MDWCWTGVLAKREISVSFKLLKQLLFLTSNSGKKNIIALPCWLHRCLWIKLQPAIKILNICAVFMKLLLFLAKYSIMINNINKRATINKLNIVAVYWLPHRLWHFYWALLPTQPQTSLSFSYSQKQYISGGDGEELRMSYSFLRYLDPKVYGLSKWQGNMELERIPWEEYAGWWLLHGYIQLRRF